jgi:hypothetical protein
MKKISIFIPVLLVLCGVLYGINPRDINDTSNIRISSPEMRAEFLTILLTKKLNLDPQTTEMLRSHNAKYEAQLQQLVKDNPASLFGSRSKKREDDKFDEFAKIRANELKQILNKKYADFDKRQYVLRGELKKGILLYNEEQKKKEQAQREAMALAEAQRKADELAKAQAQYAKKKGNKKEVGKKGNKKKAAVKKDKKKKK